jgi:iron complex outermembrane receptor protein
LTAGASYNLSKIKYTSLITSPVDQQSRNFPSAITPRVALLKNIFPSVAIYGSFSQGFSPPTKDEIYPSNKYFNKTLNAEKGNNYELGVKGSMNKGTINYSVSAYSFQVNNTIVTRQDTLNQGAEYFVNAGKTLQKGLETTIAWAPILSSSYVKHFNIWISYTLNHYRFHNYSKDGINYSGNKLTGTPPNIIVLGVDISANNGLYTNLTFNYTDKIPLNDANSSFANAYALLGGRIGYRSLITKRYPVDVFAGVDNALNKKYSLGNDLNAVGNRFYNAAPTINFYVGLTIKLMFRKA